VFGVAAVRHIIHCFKENAVFGVAAVRNTIHCFKENVVFGVAAVRHSFEAACFQEGETL